MALESGQLQPYSGDFVIASPGIGAKMGRRNKKSPRASTRGEPRTLFRFWPPKGVSLLFEILP